MTTITVTATDTAQAMDKIVERLGEDALILETVKRNGRIEMIATNSVEETEALLEYERQLEDEAKQDADFAQEEAVPELMEEEEDLPMP